MGTGLSLQRSEDVLTSLKDFFIYFSSLFLSLPFFFVVDFREGGMQVNNASEPASARRFFIISMQPQLSAEYLRVLLKCL